MHTVVHNSLLQNALALEGNLSSEPRRIKWRHFALTTFFVGHLYKDWTLFSSFISRRLIMSFKEKLKAFLTNS